jgi:hypothetical protein
VRERATRALTCESGTKRRRTRREQRGLVQIALGGEMSTPAVHDVAIIVGSSRPFLSTPFRRLRPRYQVRASALRGDGHAAFDAGRTAGAGRLLYIATWQVCAVEVGGVQGRDDPTMAARNHAGGDARTNRIRRSPGYKCRKVPPLSEAAALMGVRNLARSAVLRLGAGVVHRAGAPRDRGQCDRHLFGRLNWYRLWQIASPGPLGSQACPQSHERPGLVANCLSPSLLHSFTSGCWPENILNQ